MNFHADHIGSLLRPERLIAAARNAREGKLDAAAFRAVQDECIREAVALQEAIGLPAVTDGEFRRRAWSSGFIESVEGFGLREGTILGFRDEKGVKGSAPSPYAQDRLRRTRGIATEEFRFLKSVVKKGRPKVTAFSATSSTPQSSIVANNLSSVVDALRSPPRRSTMPSLPS